MFSAAQLTRSFHSSRKAKRDAFANSGAALSDALDKLLRADDATRLASLHALVRV